MDRKFDVERVDRNNSDVKEIARLEKKYTKLEKKYTKLEKESVQLKKENTGLKKENGQLKKDRTKLKKENGQLKKKSSMQEYAIRRLQSAFDKEKEKLKSRIKELESSRNDSPEKPWNKRSYNDRGSGSRQPNARETEGYPDPTTPENPKEETDALPVDGQEIADIRRCPGCGNELSWMTDSYTRNVVDLVDYKVCNTEWTVTRRYCKGCKKQRQAQIPGVMSKQKYGNRLIGLVVTMRHIGLPYEKMGKLLRDVYGISIAPSTLIHMYDTAAEKMRPLYDKMLKRINESESIYGDETGWFLDGKRYWSWVLVSSDCTLYHFCSTRSKAVPESLLHDFAGTIVSDSYSGWNHIGCTHQRCLLHYFRNLYRSKEKAGPAFMPFFDRLYRILKDVISAWEEKRAGGTVPESLIDDLQNRIDELAHGTYDDPDSKRLAKLLKRERDQILTCLTHDVEYHNNISERGLRGLAVKRKTNYGSRSKKGIQSLETIESVLATCEQRGVNPHEFIIDFLDGTIQDIPEMASAA